MRISRPELDNETVMQLVEIGKPITIRDKTGRSGVQIYNLKHRNPGAWENHICELWIGGKNARVNVGDLIKALRFA